MKLSFDNVKRLAIVLFTIALIILFLRVLANVLVPLVFAVLLAFLMFPIYSRLTKWKLPRIVAGLMCTIILWAFGIGLVTLMGWQVAGFIDDMEQVKKNINEGTNSLYVWIEQNTHYTKKEQVKMLQERMEGALGNVSTYLMGFFTTTTALFMSSILVTIYTFLLLIYHAKFKTFLRIAIKDEVKEKHTLALVSDISQVGKKFLKGTIYDIIIVAILCSIGFFALGIKQPIFLGLLVAVLNVIPYVGATVGGLIPMFVALITTNDWRIALGAGAVCMVVQLIDNNIIMPKVVGASVSVNALFTTMALIGGFLLWGVAGMILAIPLMGIFKVVCDHVEELKPYGYLMSEKE